MKTHTAPATMSALQEAFAGAIAKAAGVVVEVTSRGSDAWTISGAPAAAERAASWLIARGLLIEVSRTHDAELGETFVYLTSAK
jgi:hypothetical protein